MTMNKTHAFTNTLKLFKSSFFKICFPSWGKFTSKWWLVSIFFPSVWFKYSLEDILWNLVLQFQCYMCFWWGEYWTHPALMKLHPVSFVSFMHVYNIPSSGTCNDSSVCCACVYCVTHGVGHSSMVSSMQLIQWCCCALHPAKHCTAKLESNVLLQLKYHVRNCRSRLKVTEVTSEVKPDIRNLSSSLSKGVFGWEDIACTLCLACCSVSSDSAILPFPSNQ